MWSFTTQNIGKANDIRIKRTAPRGYYKGKIYKAEQVLSHPDLIKFGIRIMEGEYTGVFVNDVLKMASAVHNEGNIAFWRSALLSCGHSEETISQPNFEITQEHFFEKECFVHWSPKANGGDQHDSIKFLRPEIWIEESSI
jgi:hypothetical protein